MLRLAARPDRSLLLALDWTAWQDRCSVLTASFCVGTRTVPVAVSACRKHLLTRSQNLWEETFLRLVVDCLRAAESRVRRKNLFVGWACFIIVDEHRGSEEQQPKMRLVSKKKEHACP